VIIEKNKRRINDWKKLCSTDAIEFLHTKKNQFKIKKWFPLKKSKKVQPKQTQTIPNYYSPTLRYHLWKMSYREKNNILVHRDISYGNHPLQKYDVFYQENSKNNPLLIYVHGGGWTQGDKSYFNAFCRQYADRGFTTVSINYRLMELPKIGMNEMVKDIKEAIEHIFSHASNYFADVNTTLLMAESAGAQLAYIATTKLSQKEKIKVAVYNSITTDFRLYSDKKQIQLSGIIEKKKREVWLNEFSPLINLKNYKIETLLLHSLNDTVVPSKHLEQLEINSVINWNNISSIWTNVMEKKRKKIKFNQIGRAHV